MMCGSYRRELPGLSTNVRPPELTPAAATSAGGRYAFPALVRKGEDCLTPQAAVERQVARYRAMTGEERLRIALDLHALSCDVACEGIRHQFPQADDAEVERRLRQRIEACRR